MYSAYFKEYSKELEQDMEIKIYGESGKPAVFFPSQDGRFYQYEDFGLIEVCRPFIEGGRLQVCCVDSIDKETWSAADRPPRERILRQESYAGYIVKEIVPKMQKKGQSLLFAGVSLGAMHAANFFFRYPPLADALIALSGMYSSYPFMGEYMDEDVYYNSVTSYLSNLEDEIQLGHFRKSRIVLCTGQGAYEDLMLHETRRMKEILGRKNIPAFVDFWGTDVSHDWYWWKKQMPYFLKMVLDKT